MTNGKRWIFEVVGGLGIVVLTIVGTWKTAIATDAAFRQRADSFMDSNATDRDAIAELRTAAAVGESERRELREGQRRMQESIEKMADQIALLVQAQMREGRINR